MAEAQTSSKKGLTLGKAILIGILSVVLVVVLYIQFGGKGEKSAGRAVAYRPPRAAIAVQPANATTTPVTLATAKTPSNVQASKEKNTVEAPPIDQTRWKSPKLETIVAYDPFALPTTFPQPPKVANGANGKDGESLIAAAAADDAKKLAEAAEKLHTQVEEMRQRGVHVIIRDGDQYAAMIDDRILHVGDKIDGFTVTAIDPDDPDGVHIEKKESP